jgi:ribosomal protein L40E
MRARSANRQLKTHIERLSTTTTCPRCGALNVQWAKFCAKCGNPLTMIPQPSAAMPQAPFASPYAPSPAPWYSYTPTVISAFQKKTEIDRTKTGLILLIIGVLLRPVPNQAISFLGYILILIGAILAILGRKAFGSEHARNTIWSIVIFVVGLAVVAIGFLTLFVTIISASISARTGNGIDPNLGRALTSSLNTFLVCVTVGGVITGIAYVLFTYAIQNQNGRIILWAAYVSSLVISIVNSILVSRLVSDAVQQAISGNTFTEGPLLNLENQLLVFGLLQIIPAALYSTALYLVWSRISRGDLPASTPTPPSSTLFPPAPPPTPPAASPPQ